MAINKKKEKQQTKLPKILSTTVRNKITFVEVQCPKETNWGDQCELSEWNLREFDKFPEIEKVWYYYYTGSYEGNGEMISRDRNGKYYIRYLGHCSCYGPTDSLSFKDGISFNKLATKCSQEYAEDLDVLIVTIANEGIFNGNNN